MGKWMELALSLHRGEVPVPPDPYDKIDKIDKIARPLQNPQKADVHGQCILSQDRMTKYDKKAEITFCAHKSEPNYKFSDIPDEWKSGFDLLTSGPAPLHVDDWRWLQIQSDAERFLEQWGGRAAALGWDTLSIFGACPDAPMHRTDLMGLVWLLQGRTVAAMTEQLAMIDMGRSTRQSFPRRQHPGQVPLWELTTEYEHRHQEVAKHEQ